MEPELSKKDRIQVLQRERTTRIEAGILLLGVGLAGFGFSYVLLHLGLGQIYIRYPLCVAFSYLVFVLLFWLWITFILHKARQKGEGGSESPADPGKSPRVRHRNRFQSIMAGMGLGEFSIVSILVAILVIVVLLILSVPGILLDLLASQVILFVVFKKIDLTDGSTILGGIFKSTWKLFAVLFVIVTAGALALSMQFPDAQSFGDFFRG